MEIVATTLSFTLSDIRIRLLRADDSIDEITALIHRAFARLGRMGFHCTAVEQSPEVTALRARRGACFIALRGTRIAGTMTLETPGPLRKCAWYRQREVASLHQLAVDPCEQGRGCGTWMLQFAERWAASQRYAELALDTPAEAAHLLDFYRSHGYRSVGILSKPDRNYRSVVLSKRVGDFPIEANPWFSPHRAVVCGALVPLRSH